MYSVRVANELGRGDAKAVRFAINTILGTSIVIGVIVFILCLVFGSQLGYLFTKEAAVADAVSDLSILLALSVLFNSIYPVFSGSHFFEFLQLYLSWYVFEISFCSWFSGIRCGCWSRHAVHGCNHQRRLLLHYWITDWTRSWICHRSSSKGKYHQKRERVNILRNTRTRSLTLQCRDYGLECSLVL